MNTSFTISIFILFCSLYTVNAQINFEDTSIARDIDFTCGYTPIGNGVSFYDFDHDGWDDISFTTEDGQLPKFYKNISGQFFVPITLNIGMVNYRTKQINWVDFDNDGDSDLFLTSNTNGNRLFKNTGNLSFEDITVPSGLPVTNFLTSGASWGDYNNDGFLDVFICNRDFSISTSTPNYLFKNNGDGTFTDVSEVAGIDRLKHLSFCSAWLDINNDGWQDIYIANDKSAQPFHRNQLYKNNGDGTFTEIGASSGTNALIDAMTVTVGDYNADGWFDIYVTDLETSIFFKNNGDETFTDIAALTGTEFNSTGWGSIFLDADNDADLDLYVSGTNVNTPNVLSAAFYENLGNDNFQIPNNAGFQNDDRYSYSNAIGDINNDGLVDFVVTNNNDQDIFLWENKNLENNNWIKVKLQGTTSNRDGIGSVIELSSNGQVQYRYTHCGEGFLAQNSASEFMGIGANTSIDYIKVKWLSGIEDVISNPSINEQITIVEGSSLSINTVDMASVKLFPNPVKDVINLTSKSAINDIEVFNILQQSVHKIKAINEPEISINTTALKPGLYYIVVKTNTTKTTRKFIKK